MKSKTAEEKMERSEVYSSVEITKLDKARLNKVRGENDLRNYSQAIKLLLDKYFRV